MNGPRVALCALFVIGAAVVGRAQSPTETVPWANRFFQKDQTPAVIAHDFGSVPSGTILQHTFTITNIYDVPMQVIYVRKSCSCLEAYPPQGMIAPNETAQFKITMDTSKFKGQNAQTFNVTFGPSFISTAVIRVQATSRPDVQLSPGQINFGTVALGAKPSQTVTVKYSGRQKDWKVTGIAPNAGSFDAVLEEPGRGWFGQEHKVAVTLKPDAKPGAISEVINLQTNDPTAPLVPITVAAVIQAPITIAPSKVQFGKVTAGQTVSQRVTVRAGRPFAIEPLIDDATGVTVEVGLSTAAPVQIITVKLTPKQPGVLRANVNLRTSLDGAIVTIPIEADVIR